MKETQYVLGEAGEIIATDIPYGLNPRYEGEPDLASALAKFLAEYKPDALDVSQINPGPLLYADLQLRYFLTAEEGLALATGLHFDVSAEANSFDWGEQTYYPFRPDLNFLMMSSLAVVPLNAVEVAVLNCMSAFYAFYEALYLSARAGELNFDRKYPFDWWLDFWLRRGIDVKAECSRTANSSSGEAKPSHALAIAALLELLTAPVMRPRPNGMNQTAVKAAILERFRWRGLKERNLDKLFAEANRAAKEAE